MGRFLRVTGILVPVIFLSACCEGTPDFCKDKGPILNFKSHVEIVSESVKIGAEFKRDSDKNTELKVTEPPVLAGLTFLKSEQENVISRDEMSYKTDNEVLPNDAAVVSVMDAIDAMEEKRDEKPFYKDEKEMAFIGKINSGKFELRSDRATGFINEIKIGEKITAKFSEQGSL